MCNALGYPTLNKRHQTLVKQFSEMGAQIVIDPGKNPGRKDLIHYREYLRTILEPQDALDVCLFIIFANVM